MARGRPIVFVRIPALAWLVGAFALAGCGERNARPVVHPVEGQLLVGGLAPAGAHLAFRPRNGDAAGHAIPTGLTGPDGTFRLTTFSPNDGAPAGDYVVTIIWPNDSLPVDECADPVTHDRLNGYYADATHERVLATVRPGPNSLTLRITVGGNGWSMPRHRDVVQKD
jgi:hypothetical protein